MFFNRFGKQPVSPASVPTPNAKTASVLKSSGENENSARKRAVAIALAVQFAMPVGMLGQLARSSRAAARADSAGTDSGGSRDDQKTSGKTAFEILFGCKPEALPTLSPAAGSAADSFNAAMEQIRRGEYEKAVSTLQAVAVDALGDGDSRLLKDVLTKTRVAEREQRNAGSEYVKGTEAASKQDFVQAAAHFRKVVSNDFADAHVRKMAGEELAYADSSLKAAGTPQPIHADVPAGTLLAQATTPAPATQPAENLTPAPTTMPPAAPAPTTPAPAPAPVPPPVAGTPEQAAADAALAAASRVKSLQQQKNAYDAQKLVEKARGEQAAGQMTDALQDYSAAVKLDPNNTQASAGYTEISGILNLPPRTGVQQHVHEIQEKIQQIEYEFNQAINDANTDIDAGKFTEAQKSIDAAQVAARNDPTLFQQSQLNNFNTIIEQTELKLTRAKDEFDQRAAEQQQEASNQNETEREKRFKADQERTISNLIDTARHYLDEGKYTDALAVIDNIQKLDPTNSYAGSVRQFVQDQAMLQEQRKWRERFDAEFTHQLNDSMEKQIPYDDIVSYSPDWPKISEMRDAEVKEDRGEDSEDAALQAQLDRHLPELRFNANGLSDVIEFLRDVTGANIYVDWAALERASIAKDAPVTARLRDIKFSKALELIFKSVEGDDEDHELGYTLDEGVITISTKKELNKNTVTRRYDINDLLFVAPDYNNAPRLDLQNAAQGQSAGGGGGGGGGQQGQSLFQDTGQQNNQQQQNQDRANRVDEIKKYITDNVDTNSWKDNGGDTGSISSSPLRAVLLITQTPEAHRKIQSVLDSLRSSQALQVSIECRFLTVQRNYLEDIGVNVDVEFNPLQNPANPRSGINSSRFSPMSITQTSVTDNTTFVDANGNVVANSAQGSRTLDWISNVGNASVPGSIAANPADYPNPMVISGSYVDNLTVTFLIRAVEANQNVTSLTAPRLTLFSGQRAVLVVETQQAYVSDLTPVVAPGAALFEPTVSTTVASGVVLSVQATVSPDRKYVYMNLTPQLARLRALVPFTLSAVVTPLNNVIGGTTTPEIVNGTLQLPTIDITQVETSASVPDGATLLLGGQTLAAETTREQGVPVLSKIPFLKRLFTNRATSQDEQIILILVKPTILIQREQELKQFPQLSSKLGS